MNNKLVLAGPSITTKTIYAPYGNYNANTLITELVTQLSVLIPMTITINKINGILTFSSNGFLNNYYFTSASTILEILGTTSSMIATLSIYTCPYPLNLLGVIKLLIKSTKLSVHSVSTLITHHQIFF